MKYFISIVLMYNLILCNGCRREPEPDPNWVKVFDLMIIDKTTGENLIGSLYTPTNIQVLDENGDEQGNIYYDLNNGYIIGDIGCVRPSSQELKIILSGVDTDTVRTEYVNGVGSYNFYYNNIFMANVKWDEWGYTRGIDIPILIAEK